MIFVDTGPGPGSATGSLGSGEKALPGRKRFRVTFLGCAG